MVKGTLIPIGGNEDKGTGKTEEYTLEFLRDGILSHVVREAGGPTCKIMVIVTASSIPEEVGNTYRDAFGRLGCTNLRVFNPVCKEDSEDPELLEWASTADCVMLSGGDQSRIVNFIGGTTCHEIFMERYRNDDLVIAGTSAGAMCMSIEMISGGQVSDALFKGGVLMRDGMGFVPGLIIDSHFIQRGRFGRLAEAVARFPHLLGLGLAEDTGVIIKNANEFTVIGSGMVILFDPSQLTHNNEDVLEPGTPMSMSNLITHILANGDRFILDQRKIEVLPLEGEFR